LTEVDELLAALAATYGEPTAPPARSVFELLVRENVAYLVDDSRRAAAFSALSQLVGLSPEAILQAPDETLRAIAGAGILAGNQVDKLRRIAALAQEESPDEARAKSLAQAKKQLMRYPSIGEPGAEKILLFARSHAVLGLESNGVRVLTRLGLVDEASSYSKTYRAVQAWAEPLRERGVEWLLRAHQLLRTHGQELCKRTQPRCAACPLSDGCRYYARTVGGPGLAQVGLTDQLGAEQVRGQTG
jgi:endonuclease III